MDWTIDADFTCAQLGAWGFSTQAIAKRTGLTKCQVTYRLHKAAIKRKDYRDGISHVANLIENSGAWEASEVWLLDHLGNQVI